MTFNCKVINERRAEPAIVVHTKYYNIKIIKFNWNCKNNNDYHSFLKCESLLLYYSLIRTVNRSCVRIRTRNPLNIKDLITIYLSATQDLQLKWGNRVTCRIVFNCTILRARPLVLSRDCQGIPVYMMLCHFWTC